MGRGRQKAKQTKVARALKYYSPETDYEALQRELASRGEGSAPEQDDVATGTEEEDDDSYDPYDRWAAGNS
jgi:type IV secretory pathway VirD2 relaxase